jgi:AraC-like DNA-binding protein
MGYHDFWELLCVRRGSGLLLLESSVQKLEANDLVLLPPACRHVEISDGIIDLIWIGLRGADLRALKDDEILRLNDGDLADRLEEFWLFSESHSGGLGPELDGLAKSLLGFLLRRRSGGSAPSADSIDGALRYINEHFARDISVGLLAGDFGMSEGYFHRVFKAKTGRSPMDYLRLVRLRHAEQLLRFTELPVAEVASRSGFRDPLYFSRAFRQSRGLSPTKYRDATPRPA